jgi:prepilin-type N-terminal cleavage/methylation domain-containing protein
MFRTHLAFFKKFQKGFSLLELLVVISIIGILVSIGTASFSAAQRTTRDSRRRADVKAMQSAFEQYKASTGAYATCSTMAAYNPGTGALMPGGLPLDPRNTGDYVYNTSNGCTTTNYCVCALLEGGSGNADEPETPGTCEFNASGTYYCLTNLQ